MKKILIACLAIGLVAGAVAYAQTQVNTYKVVAKTNPTKAGTKKKPVPLSLDFNYSVGEQSGQRPAVVDQYKITFAGIKVTQTGLPACTAKQINTDQTDKGCPKNSLVGQGTIKNTVGKTGDPNTNFTNCTFDLTIYNGALGHASLYIGAHGSAAPETCAGTTIHKAIDAKYVQTSKGSTLEFTTPQDLLHPIKGFDVAVTYVQSKINKIYVGHGAKRTGYYASMGGCVKHKRKVSVTFHQEGGSSTVSRTTAPCS